MIHNYCLCVPTDTSVQEVLDNYRRLSSYDVIKHVHFSVLYFTHYLKDVLIFKMRPHLGAMKFDKANALGEIKVCFIHSTFHQIRL